MLMKTKPLNCIMKGKKFTNTCNYCPMENNSSVEHSTDVLKQIEANHS